MREFRRLTLFGRSDNDRAVDDLEIQLMAGEEQAVAAVRLRQTFGPKLWDGLPELLRMSLLECMLNGVPFVYFACDCSFVHPILPQGLSPYIAEVRRRRSEGGCAGAGVGTGSRRSGAGTGGEAPSVDHSAGKG